MIIEERSRDIGNFTVGRLLPFRKKRTVGPYVFIDHMGPTTLSAPNWMDVDQHPHIGLCTFTYLLEGEVEHRDSTGANQIISAGDVGLMSSGSGVSHTERTPAGIRSEQKHDIHGYQIWIALPLDKEEMPPRWDYLPAEEVPTWSDGGMTYRLLAGCMLGNTSPLPVHSELFAVDIIANEDTFLDVKKLFRGEIAILINTGKVELDGQVIEQGQLLVSDTDRECGVDLKAGTRVLLFGGPAFPEERYINWNFVSSSKERIEQAREDWKNHKFPKVPNDDTYISLPS